jgi:very-short-patch-repair endonuclease
MSDYQSFNRGEHKERRRFLRSNGTSAEAVMWMMLKERKLLGKKFRRQFGVGPYILDFYCPEAKLCVELDGAGHFTWMGNEHDTNRTEYLLLVHGIRVLRFENEQVFKCPEGVLSEIKDALTT